MAENKRQREIAELMGWQYRTYDDGGDLAAHWVTYAVVPGEPKGRDPYRDPMYPTPQEKITWLDKSEMLDRIVYIDHQWQVWLNGRVAAFIERDLDMVLDRVIKAVCDARAVPSGS